MNLNPSSDARESDSCHKRKLSVLDESDSDEDSLGKTKRVYSRHFDSSRLPSFGDRVKSLINNFYGEIPTNGINAKAESTRDKIVEEADDDSGHTSQVISSNISSQSYLSKEPSYQQSKPTSATENNTTSIDAERLAKDAAAAAEQAEYEKIRSRWYRTLNDELKQNIKDMIALVETSTSKSEPIDAAAFHQLATSCQTLHRACNDKYIAATERKPKKEKVIQGPHPATAEELNERLRGPAELKLPWAVSASSASELPHGGLLMRVTDESSMAKIYPDLGVLSQGTKSNFSTEKGRQADLVKHLNWKCREPTVFISTTGCVKDFREQRISHMLNRDGRRPTVCTIKLIFINGYARLAAGWFILRVKKVIEEFKVGTPASRGAPWFENEYLCPFMIGPDQIVGTYCWTVVEQYMKENKCDYYAWHRAVVLPAFKEHEAARKEGRPVRGKAGCVCCGH